MVRGVDVNYAREPHESKLSSHILPKWLVSRLKSWSVSDLEVEAMSVASVWLARQAFCI